MSEEPKSKAVLDVKVDKYRVVQFESGALVGYRGQDTREWRSFTGDKFVLAMAQEIQALRNRIGEYEDLVARMAEDEQVQVGEEEARRSILSHLSMVSRTMVSVDSIVSTVINDLIEKVKGFGKSLPVPLNAIKERHLLAIDKLEQMHAEISTPSTFHYANYVREVVRQVVSVLNESKLKDD